MSFNVSGYEPWPRPWFAESVSDYQKRTGAKTPEQMSAALAMWRGGLDEAWRRWRDADRKRALADMLLLADPRQEVTRS